MPLAIDSDRDVTVFPDAAQVLNLSWTLDEQEFLSVDVPAMMREVLANELESPQHWIGRYQVRDPYGAAALGPAIEAFFNTPGLAANVSCAAGVNAWLQSLTGLAAGRTALVAQGLYPDHPHWLQEAGVRAIAQPANADVTQWQHAMDTSACGLVFLERPAFFGAPSDDLPFFGELCRLAAQRDAVVLVDESNANYGPPQYSAVPLTRRHPNLAVLRGLSKAYGLGGLRVGMCVSATGLTPQVRARTAPLQVSSLSLRLAGTVLQAGDLTAPLRQRIAQMRPRAHAALQACSTAWHRCNPLLPYLLLPDTAAWQSGPGGPAILTKLHPLWTGADELIHVNRGSIPLRSERMQAFEQRLAHVQEAPPVHANSRAFSPTPVK